MKGVIIIDRIRLFKSETSKADLLANKQDRLIAVLDSYVVDAKCTFNLDSNHVSTITLDADLFGNLINKIDERAIVKIHVLNQDHYFVVFDPKKDLDEIELSCKYWGTATLESMYIFDSKPRNLNGLAMMDWLKTNTEEYKQGKQYARDLEVGSNLSDLKSTNIWHNNFYDTVSDLQDLYGCEIKKEGFKVELVDYVGSKTAKYKVEYGKNLISNTSEEDLSIVKGVLAKGYDKLYADNIIYSGKLIDNPNLLGQTAEKTYAIRVREEDKEDEEGYTYYDNESEAKAALERLATLEFTVNHVDEPIVTFDTQFLDLSTVEEHKNDDKVWLNIGDKVATYIPKYNIDIETRIVEMEVDILADEITNITLSNNDIKDLKPPTLNSVTKEIEKLPSVEEVLVTAKNESWNTVMGGFGGHAWRMPNFTAWMDTDNPKTAKNCLIANYNGWLFSRGGINPKPEETTMIADINGNFYADVINAGVLNANLIKAGILKSFNGKSSINMGNGTFDFGNKLIYDGDTVSLDGTFETHNSNGSNAIKIEKVKMHFYEWNTSGRSVGTIYSGEDTSNSDIKSMNMSNSMTAYLMLGYELSNGTKNSYIVLDKYDKIGRYDVPINMTEATKVWGNFSVTGSKNSLQETKSYGERLINSYETAEYYFGDIGSGVVNGDGECLVYIDEILQECINTKAEYHVFTQVYNGFIGRIERFENCFIVYGEKNTQFSWELKAKRIGYENVRLDTVEINAVRDIPNSFTEEELTADTSEGILMEELDFELENILLNGGI